MTQTKKEVLEYMKGRRVEVHGVRNCEAITETLRKVRELQGDIYDKAVELLVGLIKAPPSRMETGVPRSR